ncbi:MarR family transcriptional regulator [Cyanobacteria bacterium FACHB-471]|nr:MarR family transcriptional regulator [Cyanobacteria bacterium FACHB-471]
MTQLDEARNSLWRLFLTVHTRLVEQVEQDLKQAGLPPFEWYDVLVALKQAPGRRLRLSELAEVLLVNRTNITRLADRLEKAGLIRREACVDDRRGAFAVLTKAGSAMQQKMWKVYSQSIAQYFGRYLTEADVAVFTRALSAMLAAVDNLESANDE